MPGTNLSGQGVKFVGGAKSPKKGYEIQLRVPVSFEPVGGEHREWQALIDTGAEVSLIKKGILPEGMYQPATRPVRLVAANNQRLCGGTQVVRVQLHFLAVDTDSKEKREFYVLTTLYVAEMEEDIILSYHWLAEVGCSVYPRAHGLKVWVKGTQLWIPGQRTEASVQGLATPEMGMSVVQSAAESCLREGTPHRVLDLFSGGKSVAKVLQGKGFEVVTLDSDPRTDPTICVDILEWDYRSVYPPGHFFLIAASPPCT